METPSTLEINSWLIKLTKKWDFETAKKIVTFFDRKLIPQKATKELTVEEKTDEERKFTFSIGQFKISRFIHPDYYLNSIRIETPWTDINEFKMYEIVYEQIPRKPIEFWEYKIVPQENKGALYSFTKLISEKLFNTTHTSFESKTTKTLLWKL